VESIQTVAIQTESIRRDFPYSAFSLTGIGRFIKVDRGKQMRSLEAGRYVCALLRVKVNVLPCVHVDACLIFYLESFASGPIEYSMRTTSMYARCKPNIPFRQCSRALPTWAIIGSVGQETVE